MAFGQRVKGTPGPGKDIHLLAPRDATDLDVVARPALTEGPTVRLSNQN